MSIFSGLTSIRRERAEIERNRVVMTSMLEDAKVADAFSVISDTYFEGVEDSDIEELIARIPESDPSTEEDEVNRILASDNSLDIDGILDVEDSPEFDDEEE